MTTQDALKAVDRMYHYLPAIEVTYVRTGKYAKDIALVRLALTRLAELEKAADGMEGALDELLEVAELRGDNCLPHPADDPKTWTARMQEAWDEAPEALAAYRKVKGEK